MAITLKYATKAQVLSALREVYKKSYGIETLRLAYKLKNHIDSGDFTATEIRATFGLTAPQYTALLDRLTTKATEYQSILSTVGE